MSYILCIETSVKNCSVSISKEGNCIACIEEYAEHFLHAEKLTLFIEKAIIEAQIQVEDLKAVAVSGGPGSFTGLRIGISVAKGLCYGLDIPLIEINSLEVLYLSFKSNFSNEDCKWFIPMIDARRMEVYAAVYDKNGTLANPSKSMIISPQSFIQLKGKIVLFGDGADKLKEVHFENDTIFIVEHQRASARMMCTLAYSKFNSNQFENLAYYEPFYLKEFGETTQ